MACMDDSMCIPGRLTGLKDRQFTQEGVLSIRRKGCFFMLRIMLCPYEDLTAEQRRERDAAWELMGSIYEEMKYY